MAHLSGERVAAMLSDPAFRALVRARARLRWSLAGATFVLFFGFVLLVSAGRQFFAVPAAATTIPPGIVGAFVMVVALVVLAAVYVHRSNTHLDALAADVARSFGA